MKMTLFKAANYYWGYPDTYFLYTSLNEKPLTVEQMKNMELTNKTQKLYYFSYVTSRLEQLEISKFTLYVEKYMDNFCTVDRKVEYGDKANNYIRSITTTRKSITYNKNEGLNKTGKDFIYFSDSVDAKISEVNSVESRKFQNKLLEGYGKAYANDLKDYFVEAINSLQEKKNKEIEEKLEQAKIEIVEDTNEKYFRINQFLIDRLNSLSKYEINKQDDEQKTF